MITNYVGVNEFLKWRQANFTGWQSSGLQLTFRFSEFEKYTNMEWRRAITFGVRQHVDFSPDSLVHADAVDIAADTAVLLLDPRLHRASDTFSM